ncbi:MULTISPECIES: XdhC family protein [unclassified Pseudonocardia]|uniref:XdhC family protein n=1 Tax=unclassified Pseudonocardia TaxID=2619320 RepID=UPI000B005A25|nr:MULTISPECIES: XdhC family protein [unclassified Pseudonocardia]
MTAATVPPSGSTDATADPRRALGAALRAWAAGGSAEIGVVRVLDRHGFGTVESGQLVASTAAGESAGVLYLGALDDTALPLAASASAGPRTGRAHVSEEAGIAAGLACAGGATLLGHPLPAALAAALGDALEGGVPAALLTPADGSAVLVLTGPALEQVHGSLGSAEVDEAAADTARNRLRRGGTTTERLDAAGTDVLLDLWVPVPTVVVVGAGAIGEALLAQAALLGWGGRTVAELDEARAVVAGFSDADVVVLLDHAPRFDALLVDGVRGGRGFIGALGSRRTQAARRGRLQAKGLTDAEIDSIHGPVGLDLGARTPAETAVSIVAQVIAARSGRAATALAASDSRIGG